MSAFFLCWAAISACAETGVQPLPGQKAAWFDHESQLLDLRTYPDLYRFGDSLKIPSQAGMRFVENRAFGVGERLVFSISFGFLNAGVGILEIPEIVDVNGSKCYRVVSKAISNSFVTTFYPVRDIIVSLVDVDGLYPLQFEKHLREGGYRRNYWIIFDQKNQTAFWQDTSFAVGEFTQDIISLMYYVRTLDVSVGKTVSVNSHTDKKNYPLAVKFLSYQTIEVNGTKQRCIVVEPVLQGEGLFKQKGSLKVWMTDDERRIPLRMKSRIYSIGSVTANLISYRSGSPSKSNQTSANKKEE